MIEYKVDNETLLRATIMRLIPFAKHDWFKKHYKVPANVKREIYRTFRKLSRKTGLVSVDELALETDYPVKVVISAIQEIADSELAPVAVVFSPLTEFVVGAEEIDRAAELVKRITGDTKYVIVQNPLALMRKFNINTEAKEYSLIEELVGDADFEEEIKRIDL